MHGFDLRFVPGFGGRAHSARFLRTAGVRCERVAAVSPTPGGDDDMNGPLNLSAARHEIVGELSMHSVQREENRLLALLQPGCCVEVDLHGLTTIDAAGIQLLLLIQREASVRGGRVIFVGDSPAARGVIDFCKQAEGLGDLPPNPRWP
ncbi:MAG: STAS domain-containing protein [Rhodocyclaceae bacterium]|nr:STAS domain-containing protein [Rhodocyclaceae bacterium]